MDVKMGTKSGHGRRVGVAVQQRRGKTVSFVMTLWLEPREISAEPEWRWRVIEVQTGKQRYFRRLPALLAHVSERAGVPPPR